MEKYKCIPGKRLALKIAFQYWSITGWWYLHLKQYSRCYLKAVILWEWYSTTDRGVMEFYQMQQKMSSVSDEQLSWHMERGSQLVFFLLLVATKDSALSLCFCLTWEKEMKILKEEGSFPWRDLLKNPLPWLSILVHQVQTGYTIHSLGWPRNPQRCSSPSWWLE